MKSTEEEDLNQSPNRGVVNYHIEVCLTQEDNFQQTLATEENLIDIAFEKFPSEEDDIR